MICFSAPEDVRRHLEALVAAGAYADFGDALTAAVRNLAVLHAELSGRGAVVLGEDRAASKPPPQRARAVSPPAQRRSPRSTAKVPPRHPPVRTVSEASPLALDAPRPVLFEPRDFQPHADQVAPVPDDLWGPTKEIPIDRWLFGQYNRLLPAKAAVRALANIIQTEGPVALETAGSRVAEQAALLGERLRLIDERGSQERDDALATAFPGTGPGSEKGLLRFANQFVAATNSNGQLAGLPVGLKLLNRVNGRRSPLSLTRAGWQLACLANPAIDGDGESRFSNDEIQFLLSHIAQSVPVEAFAYRTLLAAIDAGSTTPDSLDEVLERTLPARGSSAPTKSFRMSQRSGAISRMSDLRLVARKRDGVRVEYVVTEAAKMFSSLVQDARRKGSFDE